MTFILTKQFLSSLSSTHFADCRGARNSTYTFFSVVENCLSKYTWRACTLELGSPARVVEGEGPVTVRGSAKSFRHEVSRGGGFLSGWTVVWLTLCFGLGFSAGAAGTIGWPLTAIHLTNESVVILRFASQELMFWCQWYKTFSPRCWRGGPISWSVCLRQTFPDFYRCAEWIKRSVNLVKCF
jgi:hypothetical protein